MIGNGTQNARIRGAAVGQATLLESRAAQVPPSRRFWGKPSPYVTSRLGEDRAVLLSLPGENV